MTTSDSPTLDRLEAQIQWYDRKSGGAQRWFKALRMVSISAAAAIPLAANAGMSPTGMSILGILIVLTEAWQQLNQYHHNWITYRTTCETLRHEKFLFLGSAGPYAGVADKGPLLAERVESLVSIEHSKWVSTTRAMRPGASSVDASQAP